MKRQKIIIGLVLVVFAAVVSWWWLTKPVAFLSPVGTQKNLIQKDTSLAKYAFEEIAEQKFNGSQIIKERILTETLEYTSWLFSYRASSLDNKRITGMLNLPKRKGKLPVVVMLRGYVDLEIYSTGVGTRNGAAYFAKQGFVTIAPDFLGYGGSDQDSSNILEARFTKPIEVLELLASLTSVPEIDSEKVFLWGHSNGGQIALSVLEISQKAYPTTLWAPVSKGFPESVLTYIGELDDQGKMVIEAIDVFGQNYQEQKYSIAEYWARIEAPIQIQQGGADPLVPQSWSDELVANLRGLGKKVHYFTYRNSNHNLAQDWETVVKRDVEFFGRYL